MGLQVRVRHALGERLVDLADRSAERPLVVGRAREADLKIPSVTVGSEHCVLFVHNGQWVLQDTSGGATFINGTSLEGPTPLCVGDVIVLGADASPATIEIDPAGVAQGRSGHPAETHDPVPVARAARTAPRPAASNYAAASPAPAASGPRPARAPVSYAPPPRPSAAPAADPWGAQPAAQEDPFAGWGPPAASADAAQTPVRRRKPANKLSPVAIGVGIAVCLGLIALTVTFAILYTSKPAEVAKEDKPKAVAKDTGPVGLFDMSGVTSKDPPEHHATPTPTPVRPKPPANQDNAESSNTNTTPAPTPDPAPRTDPSSTPPPAEASAHKDERGWDDVKASFGLANIGQAILKGEDYRRMHSSESFKDLDAMIDEALDILWWNRIADLCKLQSGFAKDLKAKDKDIREETSAAFKKTLLEERQEIEKKLAEVQGHLNADMSYTASDPPELDNKEAMQKLRDERDKDKYGAWKQATLKYIKSHRGSMPWDG